MSVRIALSVTDIVLIPIVVTGVIPIPASGIDTRVDYSTATLKIRANTMTLIPLVYACI